MVLGFINKAADAVKYLNIIESAGIPRNLIPKKAVKDINNYIQSSSKNISTIINASQAVVSDGFIKSAAYWSIFFIKGPYNCEHLIPVEKRQFNNMLDEYKQDIKGGWQDPIPEYILKVLIEYDLCSESVLHDMNNSSKVKLTTKDSEHRRDELLEGWMKYLKNVLNQCGCIYGDKGRLNYPYVLGFIKGFVLMTINAIHKGDFVDGLELREMVKAYDLLFDIEKRRDILKSTLVRTKGDEDFKNGSLQGMKEFALARKREITSPSQSSLITYVLQDGKGRF